VPTVAERLFDRFRDEPVFVVSGDQDWAPDWALAATLDHIAAAGAPYHLFVTNESPALSRARASDLVSLGVHPNFLRGSTQGHAPDEVIETCLELVPDATSFRTHCLCEDNFLLRKLASRGFVADSNVVTLCQPDLVPVLHGAGLLRIPIFMEDAWFLEWARPELDLAAAKRELLAPGIKVLNFHPALIAINAPSMDYYNARRPGLYGDTADEPLEPHPGRGVATLFGELVSFVQDSGVRVATFPELVQEGLACVREAYGDELYGWPAHPLLHGREPVPARARMPSR
jgi:hypothetical protein